MTVHFIGAGPGAPDLLTLRGRDLIASCPVCLYAGSLVPEEILAHCPDNVRLINTAGLDLKQIIAEMRTAYETGQDVARLQSGDLSVWSALGEQVRHLKAEGIPYTVTPGVPSFAAAAAALGTELTLPGVSQSVVLTRTAGRASAMPEGESLAKFAQTGATLALHLSIQNLERLVEELLPYYGPTCPVAIVYRATWPGQKIMRGILGDICMKIDPEVTRTALILVGQVLDTSTFDESRLYAADYDRRYRPQTADSVWANWQEGDD